MRRLAGEKSRMTRFSHHFDRTDTYYDFLVSVDRKVAGRIKEVNVFALDMTHRKR